MKPSDLSDEVYACDIQGLSAFNLSDSNGFYGIVQGGRQPSVSDNREQAKPSQVVTFQSVLSRAIVIPGAPSSWVHLGSVGETDTGTLEVIKVKPSSENGPSASYTCRVDATSDRTGSVADYIPGGRRYADQYMWFKARIEVVPPSKSDKGLTADSNVDTV